MLKCCPRCGRELPYSEFNKNRSASDGLDSYCRKCKKEYRAENVHKFRKSSRAWKNRNKERNRELASEWAKANAARNVTRVQRYRARKNSATGDYTEEEWRALCRQCEQRCVRCKKKRKLTVDHIIPLSHGGSNSIDNIQPLCRKCNAIKGTRHTDYRQGFINTL